LSYRVRKGLSYSQTRWKPFKYGLCPSCEAEELKKQPPPLPVVKPPEKPPPVQEIREPTPKGKKQGEGKGKKKPEEEKDEEKREQEERPKEEQKEKQEEQPKPKPGKEEEKPKPDLPFGAKTADLEKAKKGSDEVKEEFEKAKQVREDTTTPMFQPVGAVSAPSVYKDQSFITKMREELKDWQVGYKEKVGKRGRSLKVGEYIRSMGERPFVSRTKTSAKGQKILVVVDFSGSMMPQEKEYKKALISSMTVLDSIGVVRVRNRERSN
jgi:predicted metal-dependent peptidase